VADPLQKFRELDDLALMAAIADGHRDALAVLFDRHAGLVMSLCLRICRDHHVAEEVLIDVFHEAWRRADRYDPSRANPRTYLTTLARSRAIDRLRSTKSDLPKAGHPVPLEDALPSLSMPASADPSAASEAAEQTAFISKLLASLDPHQRHAIELAYYFGLSHSEIADKLGKPLGTIKTHVRQGLIQLRDALRRENKSALEPPLPSASVRRVSAPSTSPKNTS
jgi:RNA polymerase sigma-70 factor (ECF subfamily)